MNSPLLGSTLLLTLLLLVGLFFFVRASVKERIQTSRFISDLAPEHLLEALQQYLGNRAYQVVETDPQQGKVIYQGQVGASIGLGVFLSLLSAVGLGCLGLVLVFLFPFLGKAAFLVVIAAPLAGLFYWRRAKRPEQIIIQLENITAGNNEAKSSTEVCLTQLAIAAHRDEMIQLRRTFAEQMRTIEE